ncbi:MAG: radical SAM protein [Rhodospirillaceae bacterium]|nr:radical SAM protein [Rhodospirillaceae bacterium]|tara:strand:- start:16925 stop:18058 length:1134 start_codon:yes stop_codon:yes gene_type:complete
MINNAQTTSKMGQERAAIDPVTPRATKGRGAVSNRTGRFEQYVGEAVHDGWIRDEDLQSTPKIQTTLIKDTSKTIIARNTSPDVPFDRSINPYRGCEHGCVYCFARPTHAYLGMSPGLDFETKLFYKPEAARLLERELRKPKYQCRTMAMGTNTDPYQPVEKTLRLTRGILEVLSAFNHPVGIVTKSALVLRDLDILAPMAEKGLAQVCISVTTLDHRLANTLEPRATTPMKRLAAIRALADVRIPCGVMAAPVIPALNDHELESILSAGRDAGATLASYILLRLPLEIADLFREWLENHQPNKAKHVMNLLASTRGGKVYEAEFGKRMKGTGEYAALLKKRFELISKRLGYNDRRFELDGSQFKPPLQRDGQLALF